MLVFSSADFCLMQQKFLQLLLKKAIELGLSSSKTLKPRRFDKVKAIGLLLSQA